MPGSILSMAVQKTQSAIPQAQGPFSTQTIESQKKRNRHERTTNTSQTDPDCSVSLSAQIYNTAPQRTLAVGNGPNIDERLKAARERREEQMKLLASREQNRLEREQRARQYYEQQLRERKKKLLEHRLKEERRRAAVEEKRRQRLKEEKERYESVVRKTLEKSQRAHQNQNTRGRKLAKNIPRRLPLSTWERNLVSRLLTPTYSYLARSKSAGYQSGEEVVPICHRAASFHSMNITTSTAIPQKPQHYSGLVHKSQSTPPSSINSQHRKPSSSPNPINTQHRKTSSSSNPINSQHRKPLVFSGPTDSQRRTALSSPSPINNQQKKPSSSPCFNNSQHRSIKPTEIKSTRQGSNKKNSDFGPNSGSLATNTRLKPVPKNRTASPSPDRTSPRSVSRNSTPLPQFELPSVPEEGVSVCSPPLSLGNSSPVQTSSEGQREKMINTNMPDETEALTGTGGDGSPPQTPPPPPTSQPPQILGKPSAGTSDPEEASRLLAEKRREARLQQEREEQERLQREEDERRCCEELEQRRAEEHARQRAEAHLIEEKKRRDKEEQRQAEEEKAQAMREVALLQKQRKEEQAKEKEEQLRQERELLAQKEEAARQARKKRLEEIMRRTRRTDSTDTRSVPARTSTNEAQPKENTEPVHNGAIDVVRLPAGTKTSQLDLTNEEDMPVVAFKERRSLRPLSGLEEIQTHQRAEVI